MTEDLRRILQEELAPMRAQLASILVKVDGLPLTNRKLTVIEQEMRMLKAAFNDFARTNVTTRLAGATAREEGRKS